MSMDQSRDRTSILTGVPCTYGPVLGGIEPAYSLGYHVLMDQLGGGIEPAYSLGYHFTYGPVLGGIEPAYSLGYHVLMDQSWGGG